MTQTWKNPLPLRLVLSADSESFRDMPPDATALPLAPHPGAYGVQRQNHVHEGVDLYCPAGTPVQAVEAGAVVAIIPFTGAQAGSDWWEDTDAVLVEGASGVVVYGEIAPLCHVGQQLAAGDTVGHVVTVLKKDKGRPMTMLHLELHAEGARDAPEWASMDAKPETLRDPTPYLRGLAE
jgi:hypothetical protein